MRTANLPAGVYRPARFFTVVFLVTWVTWFYAAWLSHTDGNEIVAGVCLLSGLLSPFFAALSMIRSSPDEALKRDFNSKLTSLGRIRPAYLPIILLLMPLIMIASILVSTLFGLPADQLRLTGEFGIVEGRVILSLIIPVLAPALEELGWSGYGIDALRSRCKNLFTASLAFGVLWSLWHLPLFFLNGYYHHTIYRENPLFAVNFLISVVPLTILTNWIYFKNHRSIVAAILFHVIVVFSAEMFMMLNATKCIVTVLLTLICLLIVLRDKTFFFENNDVFE